MQLQEPGAIDVENVGGIDETRVEFSPGVTVLAGRNATNRTSLLLALMAALGSEQTSLKADADEGRVVLQLGGETYTRRLVRQNGRIHTDGQPYLQDPEVADLFAFLLENNEARRAVERGDDLRELIMRPVDTDEIQREISQLLDERERISKQLDEHDALRDEQTRLVQQRTQLESEIEEIRERLAETEAEIEARDADVTEIREEQAVLEGKLSDLQDLRSDLEDVRYSLETERESLASLREERAELREDLADLPDDSGDVGDIDGRLERLRGRKESLDTSINELQSVIQFNEETLASDGADVLGPPADGSEGDVTDQLLTDGETVRCWTCGSEVERNHIEETLDRLRSLRQEKFDRRREIDAEIEELQGQRRERERQTQRREQLERDLDRVESEIEEREARVEALRAERDNLQTKIADLEAEIGSVKDEDYGEVLDLHKEAHQLEFELERKRDDLDAVETDLAEIGERLADREQLEARREEISERLEELRTRVDRIEADAVEAFNTHMENVLDHLGYDNIERIWIERTEREVTEGRQTVSKRSFDLHVVRATESGTTYEDTVDHLSESEREVTGLVFALAGFLVHEVYEDVPFVLLDSLEAIDSERIADLVEYLAEYADNLVVALLPEDAAALSDDYHRVSTI